jgi:hypothetical protein
LDHNGDLAAIVKLDFATVSLVQAATHQLHHDERKGRVVDPFVEHLGDVRVVAATEEVNLLHEVPVPAFALALSVEELDREQVPFHHPGRS